MFIQYSRSLGFIIDHSKVTSEISSNSGISEECVCKSISDIPVLNNIRHIDLWLHTCGQLTRLLLVLGKLEITPGIADSVFLSDVLTQ